MKELKYLENFLNLKFLTFGKISITEAGLLNFRHLEELQELNLGYNKIGHPRKSLASIIREAPTSSEGVNVSQVAVDLSHTSSGSSILEPLVSLKALTVLDLRGGTLNGGKTFLNFITPDDLLPLCYLINLHTLRVGSQFGSAGYAGNIRSLKSHPLPLSKPPVFLESLVNLTKLIARD